MAQDHERATGPWQAEALVLPQAFVLTHGALLHARAIAEGLVIDADRMRANLNITHGLVVSEAVMMGLAPVLGRGEAHHVVKHACDVALTEKVSLADALERDPAVSSRLDRAAIEASDRPGQLPRQHAGLHRPGYRRASTDGRSAVRQSLQEVRNGPHRRRARQPNRRRPSLSCSAHPSHDPAVRQSYERSPSRSVAPIGRCGYGSALVKLSGAVTERVEILAARCVPTGANTARERYSLALLMPFPQLYPGSVLVFRGRTGRVQPRIDYKMSYYSCARPISPPASGRRGRTHDHQAS